MKIAVLLEHVHLQGEMRKLIAEFAVKGKEFENVLKMGRTQVCSALPRDLLPRDLFARDSCHPECKYDGWT